MTGAAVAADVRLMESAEEVAACYGLMRQLRPHLTSEREFVERWRRQQDSAGYQLVALWQGTAPVALAGYRLQDNLVHGLHLYVDDLVTDETIRSAGYGRLLMDWLKAESRRRDCAKLLLDTPMANTLGHRFYYRQGLVATALRFTLALA